MLLAMESQFNTLKWGLQARARQKTQAWTLIELIFVIAIMFLLYRVVMAKYPGTSDSARKSTAVSELRILADGCSFYEEYNKLGEVPDSLGDLITGFSAEESIDGSEKRNILKKDFPNEKWTSDPSSIKDPWGQSYVYNKTDREITCTIPTGKEKGTILKAGF